METAPTQLEDSNKVVLAAVCLLSGVAPLVARWLPNESLAIIYGLIVASIFGASAFYLSRRPSLHAFKPLFLAFFAFSAVQVLNNTVPKFVLTHLLKEAGTAGNPLASTMWGSIVIQLTETAIALVPIFLLTMASRQSAGEIYLQQGRIGFWFCAALVFFLAMYLLTPRAAAHRFPVHGAVTISRYVSLTPPLLLMVITNGFQEEILFRALFLRKFISIFGFWTANVIQALVFTIAHVGISYTTNVILFLILFVFPLGLFCGYLMRRTDSVLAPAIFHAGADIPIYLSFLSFVT
ncbi:MAG TPA: CPBP family intramembrane glutamic endopeptidase [Caulobacteraceae bacterium]|nr:CPBP family intramembrane glutamic endopeptidase [Caulobacteraceae bacterium]